MKKAPLLAALVALSSLSAARAALPRPIGAAFDKGAVFTVAGYEGESALVGFPVLVRLAVNSPLGFFYSDLHSATNGGDIAFVDMDGNGLPFEIDTWNANGESLVWVRLPTMTNGTRFVLCWGSDASGKTVCPDSPFADYVGVWHMSEASGTVADSSGHSLAAAPAGGAAATASVAAAGKVGNGRECAADAYLSIADAAALDVGNAFAVSGWFDMSSGQTSADLRFFSRKIRSQPTNNGWEVIRKSGNIAARGATGDNIAAYTPSPSFAGAGWKHVFVVYANNTATIYEDGIQKASATAGAAPTDNDNSLSIGSYSGGASSYFVGHVDECRLLDALPSADWVKAEYDAVTAAAFLTAGAAEPYEVTAAPVIGIAVPEIGYTNATVAASVSSLGTGANAADVVVQIAATADFAAPLWTTNYVIAATESRSFAFAGLATNATYYARIAATNNPGVGAEPVAVPFTTLAPGAPTAAAEPGERGFTTLAATVVPASAGVGATWATMRLEASTTTNFAAVVASPETNAVPGVAAALAIAGLDPATTYFLRARLVNDWGVETFLPLGETSTRDVPMAGEGPAWEFSANGRSVAFSFDVAAVYDGAACTATLYYDDRMFAAQSVTATGTLVWPAVDAATVPTTASVVVRAIVDGVLYTHTWTTDRAVTPEGFDLFVDSLAWASGDGFRPESPVRTIPEAIALAHAGATIWVRGGEGRVYGIANDDCSLVIPPELEGLSIRGWDGTPLIAVADDYSWFADERPVVSNAAAHVTLAGLRFEWTKNSLGQVINGQGTVGPNCNLVQTVAPFLTLSGCEFALSGDLPDGSYGKSGMAERKNLFYCNTVDATNLLVEGCTFLDCRADSRNKNFTLFVVRDNARFVGNVFSNVMTVFTGIQLANNRCTGRCSFDSNVVYRAGGDGHRGVFAAGYGGPRECVTATYNRFVNDDGEPYGSIFKKDREGFANGPVFHHNTVVGFREFFFAENMGYVSIQLDARIFDNIFVLAPDATNIVENAPCQIQGYGPTNSWKPTMFKVGSSYRDNALRTGTFNGGTAAEIQRDDWTYDITAGLAIDDTFVLGGTTVPTGTTIPAPMPDFADTNKLFSANFYRPKAIHRSGSFDYGRIGWTGENGEYPAYLGALPSLFPDATMLILR